MLQIRFRILLLVIVLVVASAIQSVKAFDSASKRRSFCRPSSGTLRSLRASPPTVQEQLSGTTVSVDDKTKTTEDGEGDHDKTTLQLKGEVSIASKPLPKTSDVKLVEFFKASACRNLLLNGGGERPCIEVEITPELLDDWRNRCVSLGARQPDERDCVLEVVSRGIQFPGLKVKSVATVGVKYVEDDGVDRQNGRSLPTPRHEFVLLKNDSKASGLAPAVWIYNKISGADSNTDNSSFKSLSTVSYEEKDDIVVFRTNAFLSIGITFPKFLLRILPGDKSVIEEKAGKSIQKTLDKDVAASMLAYENAYLSKMESSNK
jgi:hypothetical protein